MFDFAWTQIGLIGVVALVLIGPKDLPVAIKAVAGFVKKARKMAGEFQSHVDDMVKDTELAELRNQISEIRSFDIRREVERAVDPDGAIKATFQQDPFRPAPAAETASIVAGGTSEEGGSVSIAPAPADAVPAFIPPQVSAAPLAAGPPAFVPPAFIPPAVVVAAPLVAGAPESEGAAPESDRAAP